MAWTADVDELKALTAFLEGMAELSERTGVLACAYDGCYVETRGGTMLRINSRRVEGGAVSYFIDEFDN